MKCDYCSEGSGLSHEQVEQILREYGLSDKQMTELSRLGGELDYRRVCRLCLRRILQNRGFLQR